MGRLADEDGSARARRDMPHAANPADFSEALARGLAVLAAFDAEQRRFTQADLARQLGLSRATVRRAVLTLEQLGYLVAEGRSYQLTPRVLNLARGYLTTNTVSSVLQPVCDRLCAHWQQSTSVAVLDGPDAVMIARAVPNSLISVGSGIGFRVPAASSALGTVLLAHRHAGTDLDRDEWDVVRRAGYRYVAGGVEAGFHSIAVALRRWDGRVVAALNLGCHLESITPAVMQDDVLPSLLEQALSLEKQLI